MPSTNFVFPVRYVSEGVAVQTTSRELSPLGIAVRSLAPPQVGARVSMALYLPNIAVPDGQRHRVAGKAAVVAVLLVAIREEVRDAHPRLGIDDDEVRPETGVPRRSRFRPRHPPDCHFRHRDIRQVERHRHARADLWRRQRTHRDAEGAELARRGLDRYPFRHVPHWKDEVRRRHSLLSLQAACRESPQWLSSLTDWTQECPRPAPQPPARSLARLTRR